MRRRKNKTIRRFTMFPTGRKSISSDCGIKLSGNPTKPVLAKRSYPPKSGRQGELEMTFTSRAISARNVKNQCTWWFIRKIKSFISTRTRAGLFLQGHIPVWTVIVFIRQSPTNCWWKAVFIWWILRTITRRMRIIRNCSAQTDSVYPIAGLTVMRAVRHSPILKMKRMTVWKNSITICLKCL